MDTIPVLIDIFLFGDKSRYEEELKYIEELKSENSSDIFKINNIREISLNAPNSSLLYSKNELLDMAETYPIQATTLCFADFPLENNYYRKKLNDNTAVITFFQTREVYKHAGFSIGKFIIRHIYKSAVRHLLNADEQNKIIKITPHYETRGCLYDFCGNKRDVVLSADKIHSLCPECESKLNQAKLPNGFVGLLKRELSLVAIKELEGSIYRNIKEYKNMNPKYQIFVSSTKDDMEDERLAITRQILKKQHIPSTMEDFVKPSHDDIVELIKERINMCDIFLLALSGRYGYIINKGSEKGKSFVEFEYEYAKLQNKPIILMVIRDDYLATKKGEAYRQKGVDNPFEGDDTSKYNTFLNKVMNSGKAVGFYSNIAELTEGVSDGIDAIIDKPERYNLGKGWVRGGKGESSIDNVFMDRAAETQRFSFEKKVLSAKETFFMSGVSLVILTTGFASIMELLRKRVKVKLLRTKGSDELIEQQRKLSYTTFPELNDHRNVALLRIRDIFKSLREEDRNLFEYREINAVVPFSLIAADIETNNGQIWVENYFYRINPANAPHFKCEAFEVWFLKYKEQIDLLWEEADKVDLLS